MRRMKPSINRPRRLKPWRRRDALGRAARWVLRRRHVLMPTASFLAGCASYLLVERSAALAQGVALMVLASWIWILAEPLLSGLLHRFSKGRLSPALLRMVTQSLHQETLFFALPFVWAATHWQSGQPVFLTLVILAALATTIDRIYLDRICAVPWRALAFQAFCAFVAALVVVPLALHWDTQQALRMAGGLMLIGLLPALIQALRHLPPRRWSTATLALAALLGLGWLLRGGIPPVGIQSQQMRLTEAVSATLVPGAAIERITAEELRTSGMHAFASVRAPLGLRQPLVFEWRRNGQLVDRIPTTIEGGREAGFRTYSRKQHFPHDASGRWRIELRTADGQLVARADLQVSA